MSFVEPPILAFRKQRALSLLSPGHLRTLIDAKHGFSQSVIGFIDVVIELHFVTLTSSTNS